MHALEVHQLELEAQNDQLKIANEDLRATNLSLEVSRDRFRALYESAPVSYVTIDAACEIFDANHAAELVLDTPRASLVGGRIDAFVSDASRAAFVAHVAAIFAGGAAGSIDVTLVRATAPPVDVLVEGVVVRDEPDRPLRCVLGIVDITTRKRAETARRQAQEEVLAIVSHDLRGPLNAIGLACDGLNAGLSPDDHHTCVQAIERSVQRCERLIRDLLGVAHIESGRLELDVHTVDAGDLVRRVCLELRMEAAAARCALTMSIPPEPLPVRVDRDRFHQVLSNLIGNAFVHARGDAVEVAVRRDGDLVLFSVEDQGPGIPADELPFVFERYRQGKRHHGGAGLGLAIVKGLVEAHHGHVMVRSEPGHGARFEVTIAIDDAPS